VIRATDHRRLYVTVGRTNEVVVIDTQSHQVTTTRIKAGELPRGVAIADAK
jgi:YVTN family beta-propeller protein